MDKSEISCRHKGQVESLILPQDIACERYDHIWYSIVFLSIDSRQMQHCESIIKGVHFLQNEFQTNDWYTLSLDFL